MPKTVMALVPHPDDAEYHAGGLLANFVGEGARVIPVIVTDGRCGSYEHDPDELARLRAAEAFEAAQVLGTEAPIMLGYHDFEVDRIAPGELRERFIRLIREYQPDVTVSEDPEGLFEFHPDHRATARAAMEAIQYAQLPLVHPEHLREGLKPHFVTEKYYWAEKHAQPVRVVDITQTLDRKIAALAKHASQVKFLVEGIYMQGRLAGLDLQAVLGPASSDPLAALAWALQAQASEDGKAAGFQFAETYRYERYHPLVEDILSGAGSQSLNPD